MRLIDRLTHADRDCTACRQTKVEAAHEIARLRSMLFQFVQREDTPALRRKAAEILGIKLTEAPDKITDDRMFSPLHDEN